MTTKIKKLFRNPLDRKQVKVLFTKPSRAKQSYKAETDINNIMNKYQRTGVASQRVDPGYYMEVQGYDFQEAQNMLVQAKEVFSTLPSSIRSEFYNDPVEFMKFVSNDKNIPAMQELGLLPPNPPAKPSGDPAAPPQELAEGSSDKGV